MRNNARLRVNENKSNGNERIRVMQLKNLSNNNKYIDLFYLKNSLFNSKNISIIKVLFYCYDNLIIVIP